MNAENRRSEPESGFDPSRATLTTPPPRAPEGTHPKSKDLTDRSATETTSILAGELPRIEGYRLLKRLGEGGMGVVYLAEQLALRRVVALKMIRSGALASADELMRFRIEAEAIARLQHPNIVQVFDFGQQQGLCYLSLEFVDGGTLAGRIAGQPQGAQQAARVVELLARAVHLAHLRGIIHRDLKPHNILMAADGTPKISDFGLAKLVTEDDAAHSAMMVGTAGYMAPEQAWGSGPASDIGPPADVYGLGVILYEMLTGRLPFRGSTPRETLEQVWTHQPPRPRAFQPGVPRDLETICLKCLEKLPHHRYASASDLADDLARFLAGKPITARPAGRIERVVKWARRRPAVAGLVTISCAALLLVAILAGWYQLQVNENYRLAKANLQQAQNAVDQLITRVSLEGLAPLPKTENLRRELLESALRLCLDLQAGNPDDVDLLRQTARAQRQMADLYQLLGEPARARSAYQRALESSSRVPRRQRETRDSREEAVAWNNLANLLARQGDEKNALAAFVKSIAIWQRLHQRHPANADFTHGLAAAKNNVALSLAGSGQILEARYVERAVLAMREVLAQREPDNPEYRLELAGSLANLATFEREIGAIAEAESLLMQATRLLVQNNHDAPATQYVLASAENNLGAVLAAEGKIAESDQTYRRAAERLAHLTADFPKIELYQQARAETLSNLGLLLIERAQPAQAREPLAEAKKIFAALVTQSPEARAPRLGQLLVLTRQAIAASAENRGADAERLIVQAARAGERLVNDAPDDPRIALAQSAALRQMGRLLAARSLQSDAQRALDTSVELAQRATALSPQAVAPRQSLADARRELARLLIAMGDADAASRLAEQLAQSAEQADDRLASVQLLAQCIPIATGIKGKGATPRDGLPLEEYCAKRTVEWLKRLKEQGADLATLADDPAFSSLKNRPDFQALTAAGK